MNYLRPLLLTLLSGAFLLASPAAQAGNATWNLNPATGDWNTATNWTPATVPNSDFDIATFVFSNLTDISISQDTDLFEMVLNAGASAYRFTIPPKRHFTFYDAGLQNNSGIVQTFTAAQAST